MRARIVLLGVLLLFAGFVLARPALHSAGRSSAGLRRMTPRIVPLQAGAVLVRDGRAVIEMVSGTNEILVLACLGDPGVLHRVSLEVQEEQHNTLPALEPVADIITLKSFRTFGQTSLEPLPAVGVEPLSDECGAGAQRREFWLHGTDGSLDDENQYVRVQAVPSAEGALVRVYRDVSVSPDGGFRRTVAEIVRLMDEEIIPQTAQSLGRFRDVDGDGKIAVLLTPWLDRLQGGRVSVKGFVRASDFRASIERPFGNRCDMLYLNAGLSPGPALEDLLRHEYTHAVCVSARVGGDHWAPDEEDWLSEAIAHTSERSGSNLDHRLSRFLNSPERFPLVVDNYYAAGLWRNHGCRGATFLFLRWCCDQFGEQLLERLIHGRGRGVANIEAATGYRFADLFRAWSVSLARAGEPDSGTIGEIDLHGRRKDWGLAGPRRFVWDADAGDQTYEIAGTAAAYVVLRAPRDGLKRHLCIRAMPRSGLQVTRVPLSATPPDIDIIAEWSVSSEVGCDEHVFNIVVNGDSASASNYIAIEQHGREESTSVCLYGDDVEAARLSNAGYRQRHQFRFPRGTFRADRPVTVKIGRRGTNGSRCSARATVVCGSGETTRRVRPRIADVSGSTP